LRCLRLPKTVLCMGQKPIAGCFPATGFASLGSGDRPTDRERQASNPLTSASGAKDIRAIRTRNHLVRLMFHSPILDEMRFSTNCLRVEIFNSASSWGPGFSRPKPGLQLEGWPIHLSGVAYFSTTATFFSPVPERVISPRERPTPSWNTPMCGTSQFLSFAKSSAH
jgi:hypothetical protein